MLGEEDRRILSLRWWRGTRALSWRELACHRLLKSSAPLLFPHRSWGGRKGGVRGTESLSEKKAIRARREARMKLSQWEQSVPLRAESALASSACRGDLHVFQWQHRFCNNAVKFALLVRLFGSTPDSCRGWPSLQVGLCEVLIWLLEAFQRRIPASVKSQRGREFVAEEKKSEMWWQAASYSHTPLPFWRAMPPPWIG